MKSIKKTISLGLIGLILFFPYVGMAQIPEIPLVIEGEVSIGGSPAANGTIVSAFMDGAERAKHIVMNPGRYALAVSGSSATDKNKTIKLFVNGVDTSSTTVWKSGEIVTINLSIAVPSSTATASSGSSSSGSGGTIQTPAPAATSNGSAATQTPGQVTKSNGSAATQTPASVATSNGSTATQTPVKSVDGPTAVLSLFLIIVIFRMRGQKR